VYVFTSCCALPQVFIPHSYNMNVYDFDKTIFYPDSSACFILYELKKHPQFIPAFLINAGTAYTGYVMGKKSVKQLKQSVFCILRYLSEPQKEVELFWKTHEKRIAQWYKNQRKDDDLIISASPEFLLKPIAQKYGFELIGTKMDINTGMIDGENCHDSEKVVRFRNKYDMLNIEEFYSDSLTDTPMAEIAQKAFLVKKNNISPWPDK